MPAVDCGIILDARVAADSCAFGEQVHKLACGVFVHGLAGCYGASNPFVVFFDCVHEFIGYANGKIAVLEHDTVIGLVVKVSAVTCVDKRPGLFLLFGLTSDELLNVGVVDLERLHFGGTSCFSA